MTGPSTQIRGQKLPKAVIKPDRSEGDVGQWASDQVHRELRVKNDRSPKRS